MIAQTTYRHQQITNEIRHQILSGQFQPGSLLPTMHQLAEQYETSYSTVQTALSPLVAEELIERKRRVGSIVCHNAAVLTSVAIYCGSGMLNDPEFGFNRELVRQLKQQLAEVGVRGEVYMDTRPDDQQTSPLPALQEAIEAHRVHGMAVVLCDQDDIGWLRGLPIASSFSTSAKIKERVGFNQRQMIYNVVNSLYSKGCRKIGMITSVCAEETDTTRQDIHEAFARSMKELGVDSYKPWLQSPTAYVEKLEAYGYEAFRELWAQDEHPDGIIVYPDIVAKGVMTGILEQGVAVPDALKLVFHRNSGVDWFCPLPVEWVTTDVAEMAKKMIEQIREQKAGNPAVERVLPYTCDQPADQKG